MTLTCTVTGKPQPQLSWFHNNKCIDKSEDFVLSYNKQTGRSDCVIVECLPDDEGTFKCVARNSSGTAVTTCKLTIGKPKPEPMIIAAIAPEVETQRQTKMIKKQELDITGENVLHGETVTHKEVKVVKKIVKKESGEPPRFSLPIQPQVVKEGEDCQFAATVTGAPTPTIEWLKDKKPMEPSMHAIMTFDEASMTCGLRLMATTQEDVGVYSCRASNTAGRATCTANVVVVREYPFPSASSPLIRLSMSEDMELFLLIYMFLTLFSAPFSGGFPHRTCILFYRHTLTLYYYTLVHPNNHYSNTIMYPDPLSLHPYI